MVNVQSKRTRCNKCKLDVTCLCRNCKGYMRCPYPVGCWPILSCEAFEKVEQKSKPDNVNQPSHYKTGGIETLDYIKAKLSPDEWKGYLTGNIFKYISRYPHKNGKEDLKKAEFYLKRLIDSMEG